MTNTTNTTTLMDFFGVPQHIQDQIEAENQVNALTPEACAATKTIYWTACNDSSYLHGYRQAPNLRTAVRDARKYARSDLGNYGRILYFSDAPGDIDDAIRIDLRRDLPGKAWITTKRSAI